MSALDNTLSDLCVKHGLTGIDISLHPGRYISCSVFWLVDGDSTNCTGFGASITEAVSDALFVKARRAVKPVKVAALPDLEVEAI